MYGYLSGILPLLNTEINSQKYLNGHVLNRPISCFDVREITILDKDTGDLVVIPGPIILGNFPTAKKLAKENDYIYIRELIDSITSYLYNNLDDCIRKLITSFENFFILHKFEGTFDRKLSELLSGKYCPPAWTDYMNVLYSNMKFLYQVRNNIVHDKLRVIFDRNWLGICHL